MQGKYSLRYIGSLIADFHRNLLKGGVFLYPADTKNSHGKLRLMYEANPLAYIINIAGGKSFSEGVDTLELEPKGIHQTVSLIIGNANLTKNHMKLVQSSQFGACFRRGESLFGSRSEEFQRNILN